MPSGAFLERLGRARPRVVPLAPEVLALHWAGLHHPIADHRAGVMFEDLYRAEKAHPARYRRLTRAILCTFRAGRYERCARLAGEIPADGAVAPEALALFPPGTTLASLRRLVAVAAEAERLPRDESVRLLRRVTGLQNSAYRLSELVESPLGRRELDTAEARRWRAALAASLPKERAELTKCRSALIREVVQEMIKGIEDELRSLAGVLGE